MAPKPPEHHDGRRLALTPAEAWRRQLSTGFNAFREMRRVRVSLRAIIERVRPLVVVNAAALTNVDQAERDPTLANALNAIAPGVMADAARRVGALVVHYSTDYVFDGASRTAYDEQAKPSPINSYGRSKLGGERRVADADVLLRELPGNRA